MAVYQAENKVTNSSYQAYNGDYWANCSIGSGITAGGGSATVSKSAGHTYYYRQLWASGSVTPSTTTYHSSAASDNCTIAIVSNGNNRFSLSGTTLSHSSMKTSETTDTCKVRCTNSAYTSATKDASVSVTNSKSVSGTSGGVTTYGNVTAGTITNATISAAGGTGTAKAGNGSQSWSKTAIVTSYKYTSGDTSTATTTAASSGSNAVSPSSSSYSATAGSKGTTESDVTTVGSKAVTWSANSKSVGGTMYVYQAANTVTNKSWNNVSISAFSYSEKDYTSGTVSPSVTVSQSGVYTYTSGSTKNVGYGSITKSYKEKTDSSNAISVNSSTGVVTWTANTGSRRSAAVTVTCTGTGGKSATKDVTIYQEAAPTYPFTWCNYSYNWVNLYIIQSGKTLYEYSMEMGETNGNITLASTSGNVTLRITAATNYGGGGNNYRIYWINSGYPVSDNEYIDEAGVDLLVPVSYFMNGDTLVLEAI